MDGGVGLCGECAGFNAGSHRVIFHEGAIPGRVSRAGPCGKTNRALGGSIRAFYFSWGQGLRDEVNFGGNTDFPNLDQNIIRLCYCSAERKMASGFDSFIRVNCSEKSV